jgi:uncharacterized protein
MHSLSASRLNDFLGCPHQAALWLAGIKPEGEVDATLQLIRDKGFEHEAAVLAHLEKLHGPAESIPPDGSFADRIRLTREAIERDAKLIYQGALSKDAWVGYPDFLLRSGSAQSATIEPEDAKLSRKAKGEYLLQLGIYAELLDSFFHIPVQNGAIHVAAGDPESFDLHDVGAPERDLEKEPQCRDALVEGRNAGTARRQMKLIAAYVFEARRVGRSAEEGGEVLDPLHVVMLGLRREFADRHVFDHAPA